MAALAKASMDVDDQEAELRKIYLGLPVVALRMKCKKYKIPHRRIKKASVEQMVDLLMDQWREKQPKSGSSVVKSKKRNAGPKKRKSKLESEAKQNSKRKTQKTKTKAKAKTAPATKKETVPEESPTLPTLPQWPIGYEDEKNMENSEVPDAYYRQRSTESVISNLTQRSSSSSGSAVSANSLSDKEIEDFEHASDNVERPRVPDTSDSRSQHHSDTPRPRSDDDFDEDDFDEDGFDEDDFDEDEIKMENSESLENDAAHRNGSLQLQMPNFDSQYALPAVGSLRNADASDGGNNSTQTHEISVHPFIDPADNFTCMVCGKPSETEGCSIVRAQATWVFNALQQIYSDQQLQNLD